MNIFFLVGVVVFFNIWVTYQLILSKRYTFFQQCMLFVWLWLVPVIGGVGVLLSLRYASRNGIDSNEPQWYGDDGPL